MPGRSTTTPLGGRTRVAVERSGRRGRIRQEHLCIQFDLVNGAAGFSDFGRMTVGELIEILGEYAESEDYDPTSPVYLVSGNETTPRPLTEVEPVEDDDSLILVAV